MTPGQRSAANRASWAALAISVAAIAVVYYWRASLFANTYEVHVNIRTVGPAGAATANIDAARAFVMRRLSGSVAARHYRDLGNTLLYRGSDRNALAQIPAMLGAKYDLRSGDSGYVEFTRDTRIVIVGPFLLFGPADGAFLADIVLLVVAFCYPTGMHPSIVFCQILLVGALAITLVAMRWHSGHPVLPAYVAILALANIALLRWLWVTRDRWSGTMRASYWSVIAALIVVDIANALTLVPK